MFSKAFNKAPAFANGKFTSHLKSNLTTFLRLHLGVSKSFQRQVFRTPVMMSSVPMRTYGNLSD